MIVIQMGENTQNHDQETTFASFNMINSVTSVPTRPIPFLRLFVLASI